jgi:hypothetical protein
MRKQQSKNSLLTRIVKRLGSMLSPFKRNEHDPIDPDEAMEILDDVCGYFIPEKYELEIHEDENEDNFLIVRALGQAYAWNLSEPDLDETLLYLDAHSFCAWVIRQEK